MIYKVIIFWVGTIIFLGYGYVACRAYRPFVYLVFGLMLFSLTNVEQLSITFFPHSDYKMATRGFEVALTDLCAIVLAIHILVNIPRKERIGLAPTMIPQMLFITMAIISWTLTPHHAPNPLAAQQSLLNPDSAAYQYSLESFFSLGLYPLFEISKLIRGLFIFWICVNLSKDRNIIKVMIGVFTILILYFTIKSLIMRYALGYNRVTAGIGHYNNFNTFVGLMGAFLIPWAFVIKRFVASGFVWFLILCTVVCIILTISRSALLALGIALIVGSPILLLKYFSPKNLFFLMVGAIAVVGLLLKAQQTLTERFVYKNPTDKAWQARRALDVEAQMMARDHVFGVGMGNFSAYSIMRYSNLTGAELGNFAHNSFYLTLGEIGYPGLFVFILFWLRYAQVGIMGFLYRIFGDDRFAIATMMGCDLAILFLIPQLWFQFTYRATAIYLLVHIIMGIGVGQYLQAKQERVLRYRQRDLERQRMYIDRPTNPMAHVS